MWAAVGAGLAALFVQQKMCRDPWPDHEGKIIQTATLTASGVRRGAEARVYLNAIANYTTHAADRARTMTVPEIDTATLSLIDAKAVATPLKVSWDDDYQVATFKVPEVPDGDYVLRAAFTTSLGKGTVDAPLPLYAPARVHVITDRPLYEPGNVVRFRAVALRARDLAPLDGRPGTWIVKDPDGEVLLEEKAPAGDWGVVAGTFPLDRSAATGEWKVAWASGDAVDEVAFTVEPFTLPRFRVQATPSRAFYQAGDAPAIKGSVLYSSGAPVARANLEITWDVAGAWPPPVEWQDRLLPKTAVTAPNGGFELALPKVPADLQGQVMLTARIAAIDPAGDRVESAVPVLLSQDCIVASAVTELGEGLVQGFNNRIYIRVTTPDGRALVGKSIKVKRAWQPDDPGTDAPLDEDGVASLQLDPGPPVNIVIPALPWRPAPKGALVSRGETEELIGGEGASLADQVAMDRWLPALSPCAKWVDDENESARVGVRVSAAGAIVAAGVTPGPLGRCVLGVLGRMRLPAGDERMLAVTFDFVEPPLARLVPTVESTLEEPEGLEDEIGSLARGARDCLPPAAEGALPRALAWRVRAGKKEVELGGWIAEPGGGDATAAVAVPCVTSRLAGATLKLPEPAESDALGIVRFEVEIPEEIAAAKPQPTTMLGYELLVSADVDGRPATKLRVTPGTIPELRLRVSPVLAKPGDTIDAELIRGPSFAGSLPKELVLRCLRTEAKKIKLDPERRAKVVIPPGTEGWCEVMGAGARGLVYVKPAAELAVTVAPKAERYAPGDQAELIVKTMLGGKGGKAAVGLFGVDDTLGQLVSLPGADDLGRVRPKVETTAPAFGLLDGQALALGRVRGANAAAATVLRVASIPSPPQLDAVVSIDGRTSFDPVEVLTDNFYTVLAELHAQARAWERAAPPGERMRPPAMAALWKKALAACEKRGEKVEDAFGRKLRLSVLPPDLLALVDPRAVIVVGTRLPEDVENWAAWVAKERP